TSFKGKKKLWIISRDGDYSTKYRRKRFLSRFLHEEVLAIVPKAKVFVFDELLEGLKHFAETTGVKADKLPTAQETEAIKKELEELDTFRQLASGLPPLDSFRQLADQVSG